MALPVPAFDVDAGLLSFVVIAVAMVVITIAVLGLVRPKDGRPPLVTQALLALAVVGGGTLLLVSLMFVFIDTNGTTSWTWVLVAFNFMMMVPVGLWMIGHIVFEDRRISVRAWLWPAAFGLAVTGSEILMGVLFAVGGAAGAIRPVDAVAFGLSSVWFFWSMAAVMAALVLWAPLTPVGRAGSWALVLAATIGPWVRPYPLVGGLAMAALMGAAFVGVLRPLLEGRAVAQDAPLLVGLSAAFLGMTATGLSVAATGGSVPAVLAFGVTMTAVMIAEVSYLIRRTFVLAGAAAAPVAVRASAAIARSAAEPPTSRAGPATEP